MEFPTEIETPAAQPARETVEKGKVILDILALLHLTPGNRLDRLTLELGLILMRNDVLRQRIISKGTHINSGTRPTRPRIENMDRFLKEFSGSQLALSTEHLTQYIGLGQKATTCSDLRKNNTGQQALQRAQETLNAIEQICATCTTAEEQINALGAENVADYVIGG